MKLFDKKCPNCLRMSVRVSRVRPEEQRGLWFGMRPMRCRLCGCRFVSFAPWLRPGAPYKPSQKTDTPEPSKD